MQLDIRHCVRRWIVMTAVGAISACSFADGSAREKVFPSRAESLLAGFGSTGAPSDSAYENLFRYVLQGFETYRDSSGSGAHYPGLPSSHGARIDAMEGFTRVAPMVGAWLHSGRPAILIAVDGDSVDLVALVRRGILAGTDPASPGFWGEIQDMDQRLCEAADVALTLWLTRDRVWDFMTLEERAIVVSWLRDGMTRGIADNNWHLFPVFIGAVIRGLGESADTTVMQSHYARFKSFYRGEGWFSDGPKNTYDFYNAWGIHYQLYWIAEVAPDWDGAFIADTRAQFLKSYRHLIARDGIPIMGRSICYRMAAPAPLVFGHAADPSAMPAAEARRALDLTWSFFVRQGAMQRGNVAQGYCSTDERVLDNYSGPASCLWSLRSLVVAFYLPRSAPFWHVRGAGLPIDEADFRLTVKSIGWTIVGDHESGNVLIVNHDSLAKSETVLSSEPFIDRIKTAIRGTPHRPHNELAKYRRGQYSSSQPLGTCARSGPFQADAPP
ncbi:MAG: DUF2264 domain-containing protein [Anaerolineae bacterium]|nr:DUF2264 domain-containing protein [Gemmatimonadaceae bacterium]